jgi:hypothetical protein
MIYGLLSSINADIGENKCGTVMVNVVFLITDTPVISKCVYYVFVFFCQKAFLIYKLLSQLSRKYLCYNNTYGNYVVW